MIHCQGCGDPLPAPATTGRPRRYCSTGCRVRAHRGRSGPARATWSNDRAALYVGDARTVLATLPPGSAHAVVTSPPYLGQRAYGTAPGETGTESTVAAYLDALAEVFDHLARVLRPDGTTWVNLADRYSGTANGGPSAHRSARRDRAPVLPARVGTTDTAPRVAGCCTCPPGWRSRWATAGGSPAT